MIMNDQTTDNETTAADDPAARLATVERDLEETVALLKRTQADFQGEDVLSQRVRRHAGERRHEIVVARDDHGGVAVCILVPDSKSAVEHSFEWDENAEPARLARPKHVEAPRALHFLGPFDRNFRMVGAIELGGEESG